MDSPAYMDTFFLQTSARYQTLKNSILQWLPAVSPRRLFIKPNWVKHEENPLFPISALVTDPRVVEAVIEACLQKYPSLESIKVGDVPLQSCDFGLLCQQSGYDRLFEKYRDSDHPAVQFLDLRRERWVSENGFLHLADAIDGDPCGYAEIVLDDQSQLEEVSDRANLFRVSDYDPTEIRVAHQPGRHRYLIAKSILDADLFINVPKLKTHQKAGLTGALKNLVGINGSKAYLVHHRKGLPKSGGDEFPPDIERLIIIQTRLREMLQKEHRALYGPLRRVWSFAKRVKGIQTVGTRENLTATFYRGSGSWYGNDSIWRMVYDLNSIIRFASAAQTSLHTTVQREYFCVVDGIVSGEGNGPLQPLPVETSLLAGGANPFVVDLALSKLMGFDHSRIPSLQNRSHFHDVWGAVKANEFSVSLDGKILREGVDSLPVTHRFVPPPGWLGHIELA